MRAVGRIIGAVSARIRTFVVVGAMVVSVVVPLASTLPAHAYVTPYYAVRVPDGASGSPAGTGAIPQGQQVIKRGGYLYYADTGTGVITRMLGNQRTYIGGWITPGITPHAVAEGETALDSSLLPCGIEVDNAGTVYVADCYAHIVVKFGADNIMHAVAGTGQTGTPEDAADATATPFNSPNYLKFGPDGLLYVSDDDMVRRINADGSTTRIAGTPGTYSGSIIEGGVATDQVLPAPVLVNKVGPNILDFDSQGRLYIASQPAIFRVDGDGTIRTILHVTPNSPFVIEERPLSEAEFPLWFSGFAIDSDDSMWLAEQSYVGVGSGYLGYTGAIFHIHNGVVTPIIGGGSAGPPTYGNNLITGYVGELHIAPEGIYFIAGEAGGYTGLLINKNPTYTNDQFPPAGSGSWSQEPSLASQPVTFTASFADPYSGDQSSGVARAEYYIDGADPGEGNATPMTFDGTNYAVAFPANSLAVGFHRLYYRAADNATNWSQTYSAFLDVYGPPSFTTAASLTTGVRAPFDFAVTASGGNPSQVHLSVNGTLPAGVAFDNSNGGNARLFGQPVAGSEGVYPLTFTADNGSGEVATQSFTLTVNDVNAAPTFVSASIDAETYGEPFNFTVNTTGFPLPKITKTGTLPAGVTFVDNGNGTATIAGTPTRSALGDYPLVLKAKNSQGVVTQTFTLTINKVPVFKGLPLKRTITATQPFSLAVTTSAYFTAQLWANNMPEGLTFVDNGDGTGLLSGTPTADAAGTYQVNFYAANQEGYAQRDMTLNVKGAPTRFITDNTTTLGMGMESSFQVQANGFPLPHYTLTGTLPQGVTFDGATGTFSGTPPASAIGSYPLTITAKNTLGSVTQNFTLVVAIVIIS